MRKLELTAEIEQELNRERLEHPHPEVRRRMTAVWLSYKGFNQQNCALICDVSDRTVRRYLDGFESGGLGWLREIRWEGRPSCLEPHIGTLEADFKDNPPRSVAEAKARIETMTGVQIQLTRTRTFLHSLGLEWRKIAAIPVPPKKTVKEHVDTQNTFVKETLEPLLNDAKAGKGHVFFVDAAHFVLGKFLCYLWCTCRLFVRSSSGRQRFNVLGAWDAITHQFVSVCNTTVVNKETFCELLDKIAALELTGTITLLLDNARYQHCAYCVAHAKKLRIELLFLPPYSPNLNLIERIWKFTKKKALYGNHFPSFANFRSRIEDCLAGFSSTHKSELNSPMSLNFQTFENRTILAA